MPEETLSLLKASRGWSEIALAVETGRCPQSMAVVIPSSMQEIFVINYAKLILGDSHAWNDYTHPDLIYAGKYLTAPSIDECRMLQGELGLHPIVSDKRLAVVWSADKLSLEASNSLLKLTEEPPVHGSILFVSEEDKLIPTIKSRVWSIYIDLPEELVKPRRHPSSPDEWAEWIENSKKNSTELVYLEIDSWIKFLSEKKDYRTASALESSVRIMEQKRLSVSMIQDVVFAVLKEGIPCEQIFGNIW